MDDDQLLPVLRGRWSPRAYDPVREVRPDQVDTLLEAARWAPSAGNSQPWAFHPVRRGEAGWAALVELLAPSAAWARDAGLLVVNIAQVRVADTDWEYSEFAHYDLGQAVAHLTIQAHGMGLACRQFRAFDKEAVTRLLGAPPHWDVTTMTAVGHPAPEAVPAPGSGDRLAAIRWPRR